MEKTMIQPVPYDAGVYLLEMLVPEEAQLRIGQLGEYSMMPGYYYYVGSAQRNLHSRIQRHLSTEKTIRWHIDYLLQVAQILQMYTWPGEKEMECKLGERLQKFPAGLVPIPGFGASDCQCKTHLHYFAYRPNLANLLHVIEEEMNLSGDARL
jgi:sugar fermentation stimulation protein A